jgi:hypothetical protein
MLTTFAHNGHDHVKEMAQIASNGYIAPVLLITAVALTAVATFVVFKRKKK